ncbi:hypothetical protein ANO14919_126100 [Xylariales sp. No.14919]|nr:hypothetical protein ANO14919_126100 [Xylariales sp. No.14919]
MAEIFSTVASVSAVLEQSIKLFERVHEAVKRQKELPRLIWEYQSVVSRLESIVNLVREEDALKTPHVGESIAQIHDVGRGLKDHLEIMGSPQGLVRGFFRQLLHGKSLWNKLESIMRDLESAKLNLTIHIQISNVELTRGVGAAVHINTVTVEETNRRLREIDGEDFQLRISQLLEGRPRNDDGTVALSKDNIAFLPRQGSVADSGETSTSDLTPTDGASRRVMGNEALSHSLQMNTPVGVDVWKDLGSVVIENNKAMDGSVQWNYPVESVDVFLAAIETMRK